MVGNTSITLSQQSVFQLVSVGLALFNLNYVLGLKYDNPDKSGNRMSYK
jgi:hypothetical protein